MLHPLPGGRFTWDCGCTGRGCRFIVADGVSRGCRASGSAAAGLGRSCGSQLCVWVRRVLADAPALGSCAVAAGLKPCRCVWVCVAVSLLFFFHRPSRCALVSQDLSKRSANRVDVDKEAFLKLFPLPGLLGGALAVAAGRSGECA